MGTEQPADPKTAPDQRTTVLIVDDHPIFRAGLRERLEKNGKPVDVVAEAGDGRLALDQVRRMRPQVVLMDIAMPNMNGIEATRAIKAEFPETDIIILSVYDDEQYVHAALDAGASGYLLKTVEAGELADSIERVRRDDPALSPAVVRKVMNRISRNAAGAVSLSERERQVLKIAATGAGNKKIAKDLSLSPRTVEAHMRNIFDRLGVTSRTEAVTQAVRRQWITLPEDDSHDQ
ncbi:MAG: response regulator transcription factor [Actinomycetes bacterium]